MAHNQQSKLAEIDANLEAFRELLPELLARHEGQYVLLRHREVIAFFESAIEAQVAGNERFSDHQFSMQLVAEPAAELGYFSHAYDRRRT